MGNEMERQELLKLYPDSDSWAHRVKNMSDNQVVAIYIRKKSEGKLAK